MANVLIFQGFSFLSDVNLEKKAFEPSKLGNFDTV